MLLCEGHSNYPPTTAASATSAVSDRPSTSKDPQATPNDPASSDDGPPPAKTRRPLSLTLNTARHHGTPLNADQASMSRKQAKRLYAEKTSTANGNAGTATIQENGAPLADLTNSTVAPTVINST